MPELPEVETIRRGLGRELAGRRIEGVDWRPAKLRGGSSPLDLGLLEGHRVERVDRHGKFLLVRLDGAPRPADGHTFVVHLGMTGKLLFAVPGEPEARHTHLVLHLDDGRDLRFVDPRRFGLLKLYPPGAPVTDLAHYGVDALDRSLTPTVLAGLLASSASPLKAFLLDQRKIAGVGNIYACEALWRAGLSPRRRANTVPKAKAAPLLEGIRSVMRESIAAGGTSFNDYVSAIGETGQYMAQLAVFQREGEPCPRCGATVRRIVQSGRSTFYCARCQR